MSSGRSPGLWVERPFREPPAITTHRGRVESLNLGRKLGEVSFSGAVADQRDQVVHNALEGDVVEGLPCQGPLQAGSGVLNRADGFQIRIG